MKRLVSVLLTALLVLTSVVVPAAQADSSVVVNGVTVTADLIPHSEVVVTSGAGCYVQTVGNSGHACCWSYAARAYNKIWNRKFYLDRDNGHNLLRNVSSENKKLTVENLNKFFAQVKPGAILRISRAAAVNDNNAGHTLLFLSGGQDGATFYEGNYDGRGRVRIHYWSWSELIRQYGPNSSWNYGYISYIVWPNAPQYQEDEMVVNGYRGLCSLSATFACTESAWSNVKPYGDSTAVNHYEAGQTVQVSRLVVNQYDNVWAQLTDGNFIFFYSPESGANKLSYVYSDSNLTISGVNKPSGDLKIGKSFELYGKMTSTVPIYWVNARVIDRTTNADALSAVKVSPNNITLREFDLNKSVNGTNINYSIKFNKLPKGSYIYRVTAQLGFEYMGKFFALGGERTMIESEFTVDGGVPVTNPPTDTPQLSCSVSAPQKVSVKPGANVNVALTLNNSNQDVLGVFEVRLDLPSGVTLSNVTPSGIAANATMLAMGNPANFMSLEGIKGSGEFVQLTLTADATVALPTTVTIHTYAVDVDGLAEKQLNAVTVTLENNRVSGDANDDGKVSYGDLILLAKYLAKWDVTVNESNADCDGNGRISYGDLILLAKYLAKWDVTLK